MPTAITSIQGEPTYNPDRVFPQELREQLHEGSDLLKTEDLQKNPVVKREAEIMDLIIDYEEFVLIGGTGSGKTSTLPFMLDEYRKVAEQEGIILPGKIAVTQPRRLAATKTSRYIAQISGEPEGEYVGHIVKGSHKADEDTKINVMTEGILLNMMETDPLLMEFNIVMVDEAHERGLDGDLLISLLRKINVERRSQGIPPIRIAVTSATIETETFTRFFGSGEGKSKALNIEGRTDHKITESFLEKTPVDYIQAAAEKVVEIDTNRPKPTDGTTEDMVIFMPGRGEIEKTIKLIEVELKKKYGNDFPISDYFTILPLYGELDNDKQELTQKRTDNDPNGLPKRKIVVSTNIAETSLTIEGLRHVIDSGKIRQTVYDEISGLEDTAIVDHSVAGLMQRRGRVGRRADGEYHGLFTRESFEGKDGTPEKEARPTFQKAEIFRRDPTQLVLRMKGLGINDIENFKFIEAPPKETLRNALYNLRLLGALDSQDRLNEDGELMFKLRIPAEDGRMMINAIRSGATASMATIVGYRNAMKRLFRKPPQTGDTEADKKKAAEVKNLHKLFGIANGSDLMAGLSIYNQYIRHNRQGLGREWARANFINEHVIVNEIERTRNEIFTILRGMGIDAVDTAKNEGDYYKLNLVLEQSIAAGLIKNLMVKSTKPEVPADRIKDKEKYTKKVKENAARGTYEYYEQVYPMGSQKLQRIKIDNSSNVKGGKANIYLVAGQLNPAEMTDEPDAYAQFCQEIRPILLPRIAPHLFRQEQRDVKKGRNQTQRTTTIISIQSGQKIGTYVEDLSDQEIQEREQILKNDMAEERRVRELMRHFSKRNDVDVAQRPGLIEREPV